jgi:hypothetical protein
LRKAIRLTPVGAKVAIALQDSSESESGLIVPDYGLFHIDAERAENRVQNAIREGRLNHNDLSRAQRDLVSGYTEARPIFEGREWRYGVIVGLGPDAYDIEFGDIVFVNTKHSVLWNGLKAICCETDLRDDCALLCDRTMNRSLALAHPVKIAVLEREELSGGLVVGAWTEYAQSAIQESVAA